MVERVSAGQIVVGEERYPRTVRADRRPSTTGEAGACRECRWNVREVVRGDVVSHDPSVSLKSDVRSVRAQDGPGFSQPRSVALGDSGEYATNTLEKEDLVVAGGVGSIQVMR